MFFELSNKTLKLYEKYVEKYPGVIYAPHSTPFLTMTESSLIRRINHSSYTNNNI
jgi:hypothetical protein